MSDNTIPAAITLDIRDFFIAGPPAGLNLPAASVRLEHETDEPPSPRLVILAKEPKRQYRMDGTAFVPIQLYYISSMDRVTSAEHQAAAGKIDAWWRSIRAEKRRDVIHSRIYLHDLQVTQPTHGIREEDREHVTVIRGELMVTLCVV